MGFNAQIATGFSEKKNWSMRILRYGSTMPFVSRPPKFLGPFPAPPGDMIQAAGHQLCCLQQTLPIHLARVLFCGCAISSLTYSLEAKPNKQKT